jgi:putative glutamine amidotransferase
VNVNKSRVPVIGMPAEMYPGSDQQVLPRNYSDAVALAGGIPIIFPLMAEAEPIGRIAGTVDGILLTGSHSDIEPGLYNQPRSNDCGSVQPLRDKMDFVLLGSAFKLKIPVLAICFGIQSLNVFLGGSLVQDIPTAVDTPIRHNRRDLNDYPTHEIIISQGSILEEIGGGLKFTVNSSHHQAVDRLGKGLAAIAHADDGIVESVCITSSDHWVLGVQWHPEKSYGSDEFSRRIFQHFLARCRAV